MGARDVAGTWFEAGAGTSGAGAGDAGVGGGPLLLVLPDPETVALAVATAVVSEARRVVGANGGFSVALSGGSTPRRAYELLGRPPFADHMPWGATHIYWGDERCVGLDDPRSNESMARTAMLGHVPIPPAQIHPMRCAGAEAGDAEAAAQKAADDYEALLRARDSALDLVLLGLGQDGHTASLFPGDDAARERDRWVAAARQRPGAGDPGGDGPLWRVTLTAPYINQAATVYFVVTGADKAGVLRQVIEGGAPGADGGRTDLPARSIAPSSGRLVWFVDEAAAVQVHQGRLSRRERG